MEATKYPTKNGRVMVIRKAKEEDAQAIIDVINSVGAERRYILTERFPHDIEWEKAFIREHVYGKQDFLIAVAEINGKVVGNAAFKSESTQRIGIWDTSVWQS
ncbi:TPA: hypothetical protein EYP44_01140 [Candidatus Bathyarchaeota archaeon]|nr:hypothetical protein [Candidatus Bathyarchaeota archaeon]